MRVAIVGSRHGADLEAVEHYVWRLPAGSVVVSGRAAGVDQTAVLYARQIGLEVKEWPPEYDKYGKGAPLVRNASIVNDCDRLVAFVRHGGSSGTAHVVSLARKAGKPVEIYQAAPPKGGGE